MAFVVTAVAAEVVTVASVAAAVGELGVALSVVGAVTGSKDLVKIGGFLGLAGGVTSLAAGAFGAAEGAAAEGLAGDGLGGAGGTLGQAGDYGMGTASSSGMDGVTSLAKDTGSSLTDGVTNATTPAFDDTHFDAIGSGPSVPDASDPSGPASPTSQGDIGAPSTQTPYSDARNSGGGGVAYGNSAPSGSTFEDISNWCNKQPEAVKAAVIRGGASAVGGMFQGWSEEQKLALERNKFALQQRQLANGSAQPTIGFQTKPVGIINTARGI